MNEDVLLSKVSEGFIKIFCPKHIGYRIRDNYKFFSPGYKFHPLYKDKKKRVWDGKVSLLNLKNRLFPYGLLNNLIDYLEQENISYALDFKTTNDKDYRINDQFMEHFYKKIFADSEFYPRDYQHEAIRNLLYNKRAVVEECTGSGKSLIIYCLIRYLLALKKRVVLIVPNIMLVEQMRKEFKEYGWTSCDDCLTVMYMEHVPDISKPVLVSTYQSMVKQDDSFIARFNSVIVDEAHQAPANSIQTILSKLVYADYRMGMTGTLPDYTEEEELGKIYEIFGYLGPLVAQKKAIELMDDGYLSQIKIANIIIKYPERICLRNKRRAYEEEVITVTENPDRNTVFGYILDHVPPEENTIILCYRLVHLDSIFDYVQKRFGDKFSVRKISGSVDAEKRIEIQNEAENTAGVVIVATYGTMSIGVNIKRMHNVVLGSSYKSKVRILQTIGRGLRLHETKEWLTLFDVVDDLRYEYRNRKGEMVVGLNHLWKHFEKRLQHYKNQGYEHTTRIINLEDL